MKRLAKLGILVVLMFGVLFFVVGALYMTNDYSYISRGIFVSYCGLAIITSTIVVTFIKSTIDLRLELNIYKLGARFSQQQKPTKKGLLTTSYNLGKEEMLNSFVDLVPKYANRDYRVNMSTYVIPEEDFNEMVAKLKSEIKFTAEVKT